MLLKFASAHQQENIILQNTNNFENIIQYFLKANQNFCDFLG